MEVISFPKIVEDSSDILHEIDNTCSELSIIYSGVHPLGIYLLNFTEIAMYVEQTKDSWKFVSMTPLYLGIQESFVDALDLSIVNVFN